MRVSISWSDEDLRRVVAAIEADSEPKLDPGVAFQVLRLAQQPVTGGPPSRTLTVSLEAGQVLKRWCDEHRAAAAEREPDAPWTRIVASVNEAVQWAAPAHR